MRFELARMMGPSGDVEALAHHLAKVGAWVWCGSCELAYYFWRPPDDLWTWITGHHRHGCPGRPN